MNIILLDKEEVLANLVIVDDHRAKHIVKVLRSQPGDRVKVGVINGMQGTAEIISCTTKQPHRVEMLVTLKQNNLAEPIIDLLLAMPRPIMLKRILSQATSLGVGTFYLINSKRVEKSFWNGSILDKEQYRYHLLQGLEQAVDTRVPEVEIHRYFKTFVEKVMPTIQHQYSHLVVAHPGSEKSAHEIITKKPSRILLAVGPEGGWIDYEMDKLKEQGFVPFSHGERILKVDTAVIAFISQLDFLARII